MLPRSRQAQAVRTLLLVVRTQFGALVAGLGVAQLLAWGSLYYAIAVMGESMRAELALSESQLYGAFTWALVISGVLAPWSGRTLDRYGGRAVLASSALVGALGFAVLGRSDSFGGSLVGWSINGVAMSLGLYDTCFAALGQVEPLRYGRAVTGVTLIAGFASTVSWPVSHQLLHALGWRGLCDVYAVALAVCALLYAMVLPSDVSAVRCEPPATAALDATTRRRARLLAWTFAGAALIGASVSAHLLRVLMALKLPAEQAVWVASSLGVMQVLGRLLEFVFGAKHDSARVGLISVAGLLGSMVLLLALSIAPWLVVAFAVVYGIANGLLTIVKATLPVQIFGLQNVGAVLGSFGRPSLVTRALAPLCFAMAESALGTRGALVCMVAVGIATLASYITAMR